MGAPIPERALPRPLDVSPAPTALAVAGQLPAERAPPAKPTLDATASYESVPDKVVALGSDPADPDAHAAQPARVSKSNHSESGLLDDSPAHSPAISPDAQRESPVAPLPAPADVDEPGAPVPSSAGASDPNGSTVPPAQVPAVRPARAVLGAALIGVVLALGWLAITRHNERRATAPPSSATREPTTATTRAPSATRADASAALEEVAGVTVPTAAAAAPVESAPPQKPTPALPDRGELADDECWLLVQANVDARVFVHGIDLGRTGQWLKSRCGMRFIRLGSAPGQWLSEGVPQRLVCGDVTTLEVMASRDRETPTSAP
jgi:hypothetical protein